MSSRTQILENIEKYANKVKATEYHPPDSSTAVIHEARLEKTLNELNARVEKERAALDELITRTKAPDIEDEYHLPDGPSRMRQLQIFKNAYTDLTPVEPQFPATNSALPALLALRTAQKMNSELKASIQSTYVALKAARQRLATEQSDLHDAEQLTKALETRIETLRGAESTKAQQSPDEAARALVETETARKQAYDRDTKQSFRALVRFVEETLAPMLAAEELGGPVAGAVLDVSEEMLAAGFTNKHKPKRAKAPISEDKRQQRIDKIWGAPGDGEEFDETPRSETQAAAEEMKNLVQELLNAAAEGGGSRWVRIERDSAAARFLVRSGVAVLKDSSSRDIRLVDFARDLDD